MVKNELYTFKEGSLVSAYKIADFTTTEHLVKTTLSTLRCNSHLQWFAVSYWAAVGGSIVLTGGCDSDYVPSAQTHMMAVQTGRWQQKSFPDLNVARMNHASLGFANQCYVACGHADNDLLSSMEMLRLGAHEWELIDIPDLTPRHTPIIAQIDSNSICILGGIGR